MSDKTEVKPVRYHLEIYLPDSDRDVLAAFRAGQSFLSIAVGELIDQRAFPGGSEEKLRVSRVEHLVWEVDTHVSHKVMVFTTKQ